MLVTHAWSMNGSGWTELSDAFGEPTEEICHLLNRLNGKDRCSLTLWRLPEGAELGEVSLENEPQNYIQAAGATDRMTVEVRRLIAGKVEHCIVGRKAQGTNNPDKKIVWGDNSTLVNENEVFTSAEACMLFIAHYRHNWLSGAEYSLRLR